MLPGVASMRAARWPSASARRSLTRARPGSAGDRRPSASPPATGRVDDYERVLRAADAALYEAKRAAQPRGGRRRRRTSVAGQRQGSLTVPPGQRDRGGQDQAARRPRAASSAPMAGNAQHAPDQRQAAGPTLRRALSAAPRPPSAAHRRARTWVAWARRRSSYRARCQPTRSAPSAERHQPAASAAPAPRPAAPSPPAPRSRTPPPSTREATRVDPTTVHRPQGHRHTITGIARVQDVLGEEALEPSQRPLVDGQRAKAATTTRQHAVVEQEGNTITGARGCRGARPRR